MAKLETNFPVIIHGLVTAAVEKSGYANKAVPVEPVVLVCGAPGTYSSNHAIQLGHALRCNPRLLAAIWRDLMLPHLGAIRVEVNGHGFLTFFTN